MIKLRQIKIKVEHDNKDYLLDKIIKKLNTKKENIIDYKISKKSIDARRNEIYYVYEVIVNLKNEIKITLSKDIIYYEEQEYKLPPSGDISLKERPIIVGSGPAGLFSAYILVSAGYKPIIIERGKNIELRTKDVEKFWESEDEVIPARYNATYVMNIDNFLEMSKTPKIDLMEYIKNNPDNGVKRIYHSSYNYWQVSLNEAINNPHLEDKINMVVDFIKNIGSEGKTHE